MVRTTELERMVGDEHDGGGHALQGVVRGHAHLGQRAEGEGDVGIVPVVVGGERELVVVWLVVVRDYFV
jgi:hypothetical protein